MRGARRFLCCAVQCANGNGDRADASGPTSSREWHRVTVKGQQETTRSLLLDHSEERMRLGRKSTDTQL